MVLQGPRKKLAAILLLQAAKIVHSEVTGEHSCRLCANGASPTQQFLDAEALAGFTCEEYADYVSSSLSTTDEGCTVGQAIGSRMCGCPQPEVGDNICTLCRDGGKLAPESSSIVIGKTAACDEVAAVVELQVEASEPSCNIARATLGHACGCGYDPLTEDDEHGICRVCGPPGTTLPDPSRVVDLPHFGSPTTCAVWESAVAEAAVAKNGTCGGELREAVAAACCCSDSDSGEFLTFEKEYPSQKLTCQWLAGQNDTVAEMYCASFGQVRRSCRASCNVCEEDELCADKRKFTFSRVDETPRSCRWISRRKPSKVKKICERSPSVRESCKATCGLC